MTNQEQYEKMLIDAAKMIKENCIKQIVCENCAFYARREPPFECIISDGSMFTPHEWGV